MRRRRYPGADTPGVDTTRGEVRLERATYAATGVDDPGLVFADANGNEVHPHALSQAFDRIIALTTFTGSGALERTDDAERAALYTSIGVSAVYDPDRNEVHLGVDPVASTPCRRGDLNPHPLTRTSPSS